MKNILVIIFVVISTVMYAQSGQKNFIDQNYIEVTGKAEMKISPDKIYLNILLNEKDTKNKTSMSELEAKMVATLKKIEIDIEKNLTVKDMASNLQNYLLTKNKIFLSKEYQVLVTSGQQASKVFIELEKIGISNISVDRLENSKIEQYREETKINAIKAAKKKANLLALAVDQTIGKALYIKEIEYQHKSAGFSNALFLQNASMNAYGSKAKTPTIDFEKIKLEYTILCRFELK